MCWIPFYFFNLVLGCVIYISICLGSVWMCFVMSCSFSIIFFLLLRWLLDLLLYWREFKVLQSKYAFVSYLEDLYGIHCVASIVAQYSCKDVDRNQLQILHHQSEWQRQFRNGSFVSFSFIKRCSNLLPSLSLWSSFLHWINHCNFMFDIWEMRWQCAFLISK